ATALLRALGYGSDADIYRLYYGTAEVELGELGDSVREEIEGKAIAQEFVDPETGEVLIEDGEEIDGDVVETLQRLGVDRITIYKSERQTARGESPLV